MHPCSAVKNAFGKQLGTANPLNNARATLEGIKQMRTFQQVQIRRKPPGLETMQHAAFLGGIESLN